MQRLQWQGFHTWLKKHDKQTNHVRLVSYLCEIRKEFDKETFDELVCNAEFLELFRLYCEYSEDNNDPMSVFWNTYLEMVSTLMNFIRATREGNWKLHLDSVKEMLPWLFAYDHTNYARYLPVYLVTMMSLQDTHPEAHRLLADGDFGVQRSTVHGFPQLPVDQTIEQTLNRSIKTKGGIVGFSLRKGAVQRWMLTAHSRAAFADKCREMVSMEKDQDKVHKEMGCTRMQRDEADVKKVMDVVQNWCNPFEPSDELVSLGSGYVAHESLKRDLLQAKEKRSKALVSFIADRLLTSNVGLYETLSKFKLGTFRDAQKRVSVRAGSSNVILRADRDLFARLLVIAQSRQMDL